MSIFYSMMTCVAARWAKHLKLRRFKIKVRVKEGCAELSTHKLWDSYNNIDKCRFLGHIIVYVSTVHLALPAVNVRSQKNEILCDIKYYFEKKPEIKKNMPFTIFITSQKYRPIYVNILFDCGLSCSALCSASEATWSQDGG